MVVDEPLLPGRVPVADVAARQRKLDMAGLPGREVDVVEAAQDGRRVLGAAELEVLGRVSSVEAGALIGTSPPSFLGVPPDPRARFARGGR